MALEITNLRFLDALRGGRPLGVEVSMLKIRSTEFQQNLHELALEPARWPWTKRCVAHRASLCPLAHSLPPRPSKKTPKKTKRPQERR